MALSPQELQMVKDLKARGVSNTLIMGHIAQARQGRPSIASDMMKAEAQSEKKGVKAESKTNAQPDKDSWSEDLKTGFQGAVSAFDSGMERVDEARAKQSTLGKVTGHFGAGFRFAGEALGSIGSGVVRALPGGTTVSNAVERAVGAGANAVKESPVGSGAEVVFDMLPEGVQTGLKDAGNVALGGLGIAGALTAPGAVNAVGRGVARGAQTTLNATTQATKGAVDAISDIQMPNIPNVAPGLTQATRDFASRAPRAINNLQEGLQDKAMRAERIRNSPPMVAKAIEVNVPDNTISLVTETDAPTRKAMMQMLDVAESGARDARPSRVAGDAVAKQYQIIDNKRKEVGKALEQAIDSLPNATVDMRLAYKQLSDTLAENGIRVGKDGKLDFSQSSLPTQQRGAVQRLYDLTTEAGDTMNAKMVHAKDRMFSAQKRADMKTDMLDDVMIKVNGETKSIYDTFRDIYRNQLDNLDDGKIRAINKDYAILRNTIDEADNSIFKTSRTKGIEIDPSDSAMVNLRRLEGEALSTPYFQKVADTLDTTSRVLGYNGAKPRDLITFAEDLRAIYPDTVPKAGFTGSIRTAVKPSVLDLADKALGAGTLQAKDQQKALRKLLSEYDDYLRTMSDQNQNI
jgi:hypothetical protein